MFLEERMEILRSVKEIQGNILAIKEYMECFYPEDATTEAMFNTVEHELSEAEKLASGVYGTWPPLSDLLESHKK